MSEEPGGEWRVEKERGTRRGNELTLRMRQRETKRVRTKEAKVRFKTWWRSSDWHKGSCRIAKGI